MRTKQAGYTLVELLVYVAAIGGLLFAITGFFGISATARIKNQSIAEVNQQAVFAMDYITQAIRNADSITLPLSATSGPQLTLAMPLTAQNPTIISLSGTSLQTQEGVSTAVPLTGNKVQISNLSFTNVSSTGSPGAIRVSFTVAHTNTSGRNEYDYTKTFTTTAALRWP